MPTVLVIDGEALVRLHLRVLLEGSHYVVLDAGNGRAALQAHRDRHIDVAVVDLAMPETNGLETIAVLRRRWPNIRIGILTGTFAPPEFDTQTILRKAGADAAFTKPINDAVLLAQLVQWAGQSPPASVSRPAPAETVVPFESKRSDAAGRGVFAKVARERLAQLRNACACIEQNEFPEANLFRVKRYARKLAELAADAGRGEVVRLALELRDLVQDNFRPNAEIRRRIGVQLDMIATICVAGEPGRAARVQMQAPRLESASLKI